MATTGHLVVTPEPDRWALKWQQDGRTVGLLPMAFGILCAAGGLDGRDVSGSQRNGMMMCISLTLRGNEQAKGDPPPPPIQLSLVTERGRGRGKDLADRHLCLGGPDRSPQPPTGPQFTRPGAYRHPGR